MSMLIALLPGDGIGPEVITEARRVLDALRIDGLTFEEALVGGAAYKATGHPLPADTLALAKRADAIGLLLQWLVQCSYRRQSGGKCGSHLFPYEYRRLHPLCAMGSAAPWYGQHAGRRQRGYQLHHHIRGSSDGVRCICAQQWRPFFQGGFSNDGNLDEVRRGSDGRINPARTQ